jgi:outer membrane protein assembly factor BamB
MEVAEFRRLMIRSNVTALLREDGVEARDAGTGQSLWSRALSLEGRPAADPERWYFGTRGNGPVSIRVNACDLRTGEGRWRSPALAGEGPRSASPRPGLERSRLWAAQGCVLVVMRGWCPQDSHERPPAGVRAEIYCLDAARGGIRWRRAIPDYEPVAEAQPIIAGGGAVVHDGRELIAFDLATAAERWRRPAPVPRETLPLAGAGLLLVLPNGTGWLLRALNAADGSERWHRPLAATGVEINVDASGPRIVVQYERSGVGGSTVASVAALDAQSGAVEWQVVPEPALESQVTWPLGLAVSPDGRLIAGYQTSNPTAYLVCALSLGDGSQVWRHPTADPLQEMGLAEGGLLLLHESGYGRGRDRLSAVRLPR